MVVLDLEWNQGYGRHELEEIIQLGAVQLTELGGTITNTFNTYIRPTLYKTLSVGARHLPDLSLSLSSETEFSTAYRDFVEWCGGGDGIRGVGASGHFCVAKERCLPK